MGAKKERTFRSRKRIMPLDSPNPSEIKRGRGKGTKMPNARWWEGVGGKRKEALAEKKAVWESPDAI